MTATSRAERSRGVRGVWWFRPLAAVLAVWVVTFVAEPTTLHVCPLHDGVPHEHAAAPATGAGHAHHGSAVHGEPAHDADRRTPRHACTCPGACCASTPLAVPTAGAVLTAASVVASPRRRPIPAPTYRRTSPEHARPPSVGPPAFHIG